MAEITTLRKYQGPRIRNKICKPQKNAHQSKIAMITDNDEVLLAHLVRYSGPFDATKIHAWVQNDPNLFEACRFLQVRPNKLDQRADVRRFNETTLKRIRRWFDHVQDKPVNGIILTRDRLGWCYLTPDPITLNR